MRTIPLKIPLLRGRPVAMCRYCPCPGKEPGAEPEGADGAGGPGGIAGGATPAEMCPSIGDNAAARLISPMTTRITGYVFVISKLPPRISCRRSSTPMVMTMAGPRNPRMVHRRHAQRKRSLIENSLLGAAVQPVPEH